MLIYFIGHPGKSRTFHNRKRLAPLKCINSKRNDWVSEHRKIDLWNSLGRLQNTELSKCSQSEKQPSVRRPISKADWQKEKLVEKLTNRCIYENVLLSKRHLHSSDNWATFRHYSFVTIPVLEIHMSSLFLMMF